MEISRLTAVPAICKCRGCSRARFKYDSDERRRGSTLFRRNIDASFSRPRRRWRPKAACPRPEMASPCARCRTPSMNLRREQLMACGSPGLRSRRGRNLRPPTLGGIPGIRECTMTTVVPCLSLRDGICSVGCRHLQVGQLSTASAPMCSGKDCPGPRVALCGRTPNHSWQDAHRYRVHRHTRWYGWVTFDVNQLNRPSLQAEDLGVLDQVAHLLGIDGHA